MDNACFTRWALTLQPFNFKITYRPEKTNTVTDFLSRSHEDKDRKEPGVANIDPVMLRTPNMSTPNGELRGEV